MTIRQMALEDTEAVCRTVVASFLEAVAVDLSEEGVATFLELAAPEAFAQRMTEDNSMYVYEEGGKIIGMVEVREGRHLAMLFVAPDQQSRGVGHELVQEALRHRRVESVTVSASLRSVSAYESYGFEVVGPEGEDQGLRYIPMKIEFNNPLNSDCPGRCTPLASD